ncbi:ankyrin repeat-containing domain protein [Hypomontagnella monticulosa]|nr:ankyrin repeat-containing domain protein [Hypomontagnella monticulosa]
MNDFKYGQLDLKQFSFRILRLQKGTGRFIDCELIQATLDENVIPYEAVSYTWGSMVKTDPIYIRGRRLSVTQNLYLILHDLRLSDKDRYLWVDGICINQDDVHERGHQVQQMKRIYSSADYVLCCLGRPTEETRLLMTSLRELHLATKGRNWKREDIRWNEAWEKVQARLMIEHSNLEARQRRGLEHILGQSWFNRVWILQEVDSAKSGLVYSGYEFISARIFALAPRLVGVVVKPHCQSVLDLMPGLLRRSNSLDRGRDLVSLIRTFSGAEAHDERDKVYALLGMCSEPTNTLVDYTKSFVDVLFDTIRCEAPFCNIPNIQKECEQYRSDGDITGFLAALEVFESEALVWLIETSDLTTVQSFLNPRLDSINITDSIVATMKNNKPLGMKILEILLRRRDKQVLVTMERGTLDSWIEECGSINSILSFVFDKNVSIEDMRIHGTPLLWATCHEDVDTVLSLLRHGANIETKNEAGETPLVLAMRRGNVELVRLLLEHGANANPEERTLLLMIGQKNVECIQLLLKYGLDINATDRQGWTELTTASKYGDTELIQLLLGCGADINARNREGHTPLYIALSYGHVKTADLFIKHGVSIESSYIDLTTLLISAVAKGNTKVIKWLLAHGADIDAKGRDGKTPLGEAINCNETEAARLLLDRGASVEFKDQYGYLPGELARRLGRKEVTHLIEKRLFELGVTESITQPRLMEIE